MRNKHNIAILLEGADIPRFYSLNEVSEILDIPMGTLYNMSYRKVLPCIKIGRKIKLTADHIKQIIEKEGKLYGC